MATYADKRALLVKISRYSQGLQLCKNAWAQFSGFAAPVQI
jgi:hypothetical protein